MRVRLLRKRERERERERQESNHDQQILIERLQSGNNWDNCSTLEEGRTNRTRDGLKDTVLGKFQTQSEMQNKSEDSSRRSKCTGRNVVARLFQEILASKLSAFTWLSLLPSCIQRHGLPLPHCSRCWTWIRAPIQVGAHILRT